MSMPMFTRCVAITGAALLSAWSAPAQAAIYIPPTSEITYNVSNFTGSNSELVQGTAHYSTQTDLVKLWGNATLTADGQGTLSGVFDISGNAVILEGEGFRMTYVFDATLTGSGTVTITCEGSVTDGGFFNETLSQTEIISAPGTHHYQGDVASPALPQMTYLSWQGQVHIDWTGGQVGDTFTIDIPDHSVDFMVGLVPEPSSFLGVSILGGLLLFRRSR